MVNGLFQELVLVIKDFSMGFSKKLIGLLLILGVIFHGYTGSYIGHKLCMETVPKL